MATTPTNNPIPSEDPRDLKFNSGKFDEVMTSDAHYYTDRFGVQRWTIAGFEYTALEAIRAYGYVTLKSFQLGAPLPNNELTLPNQVLQDETNGEYYRWDGAFPKAVAPGSTPASTGGEGPGAWLSVGDAALRSGLAANDGLKFIGQCPDIATLRTIEPGVNGQRIILRQHTSGTGLGGGSFRAVMDGTGYVDDNGVVIKTTGGAAWLRINADRV
ncbi:MAG: hypothetical protein E7L15_17345, partial [Citrobacter portucalensis]|nr:hypothetical protein [Citrobacter portucalensis]